MSNFSKKFQHICVSLNVNFNESLTNDIVSFEQLGPDFYFLSSLYDFCRNCFSKQEQHMDYFYISELVSEMLSHWI